ncbi:hypothetical protein RUM44_003953 [Polyplax serrata]|uniref:Peptidase metallopeptidase domain-containing protein n=1 Tax=Polyplax serrata TaxID=468196 RepID=A0ABR1B1G1_POLSC
MTWNYLSSSYSREFFLHGDVTRSSRGVRKYFLPVLLLIEFLLVATGGFPSTKITEVAVYLSKYGYLPSKYTNPTLGNLLSKETFTEGLKDYQEFFGLNATGVVDEATARMMRMPRCGVPDKVYRPRGRRRRFTYTDKSHSWNHTDLTYYFHNYSKKLGLSLSKEQVQADIKVALDHWANASFLTFTKTKRRGDMKLLWGTYSHGDRAPFDGPGGTLAHAFAPGSKLAGDTHFDDSETWTHDEFAGANLIQVATHEFGHALGLSHSKVKNAVMYPSYNSYKPLFKLEQDDIKGIQSLYGQFVTREKTKSFSELCLNYEKINAILTDAHRKTYIFKDQYFWELDDEGLSSGYPQKTSLYWPEAPYPLDAALNYDNLTYFFKDKKCWCYRDKSLVSGFPKYISKVFKGMPTKIDAAIVWKRALYFFKGKKCYKHGGGVFSTGKSISKKWYGLPDDVTAAFVSNQNNYIFVKKRQYFKLDAKTGAVEKNKRMPYPRNFRDWWLNCGDRPRRLDQYE